MVSSRRWRPITEIPDLMVETAMIKATDRDGEAHLLPGPVAWSDSAKCWTSEATGQPVRYHEDHDYHWIPESDLL